MRNRGSSTLVQELAQALSSAERCVLRQVARALADEGVSVEEWRTMQLLADGRGHRMSEISEFAFVPAPSLTRLIDRMVTDGLVHRRVDETDRRRVLVHLTPRGRALQRRLAARVEREQPAMLAGDDPADAQQLLGLLSSLVTRLR